MTFRDGEQATIDRLAKDKGALEARVAFLEVERDALREGLRSAKMSNAGAWLKRLSLMVLCAGIALASVLAVLRYIPQRHEVADPHAEEKAAMEEQCDAVCAPHRGDAEWDQNYKLVSCACDMKASR